MKMEELIKRIEELESRVTFLEQARWKDLEEKIQQLKSLGFAEKLNTNLRRGFYEVM